MDHKNINEEGWAMTGRNGKITEGGRTLRRSLMTLRIRGLGKPNSTK
jgi:hypothetical protein